MTSTCSALVSVLELLPTSKATLSASPGATVVLEVLKATVVDELAELPWQEPQPARGSAGFVLTQAKSSVEAAIKTAIRSANRAPA